MELRLSRRLLNEVRADLERPHPFAYERVGFIHGRLSHLTDDVPLILLHSYYPVLDEQYEEDQDYAACIGQDAISQALQRVRDRNWQAEGAFHIHLHGNWGQPWFSGPDLKGLPPLMPSFARAGRLAAHGLIVLSENHGLAWVWLPGRAEHTIATRIAVAGSPLELFEYSHETSSAF